MNILSILQKNPLFQAFPHEKLAQLLNVSAQKKILSGQIVLAQGEVSDFCYVILSGEVVVYIEKNGDKCYLARLGVGDYFGEQALLHPDHINPRNASVSALCDCTFLLISQEQLLGLLNQSDQYPALLVKGKDQIIQIMLTLNRQLEGIGYDALQKLKGEMIQYPKGTFIFQVNQLADFVYYIIKGEVKLDFSSAEENKKSVKIINKGEFFGELGVIEEKTRKASATAETDVILIRFDKKFFIETFKNSESLKNYFLTIQKIYHIPIFGTVIESQTEYEGEKIVTQLFGLQNGRQAIANYAYLTSSLSINILGEEKGKSYCYEKDDLKVVLSVSDKKLMQIVCSKSTWKFLPQACNALLNQMEMTEDHFKHFSKTGELTVSSIFEVENKSETMCYCMNVTKDAILERLHQGFRRIEDISDLTGAGTVCRGCVPSIYELLGEDPWISAYVDQVIKENPIVNTYVLRPIESSLGSYFPGQHIVVQVRILGELFQRAYSLSSYHEMEDHYQIMIKKEETGIVSNWLSRASGRKLLIKISRPKGDFFMRTHNNRPILFFAAGIGVTPALAFVDYVLFKSTNQKIYLDYSVRDENLIVKKEHLDNMSQSHFNIKIRTRFTKKTGHITGEDVCAIISEYESPFVYACGSEKYIASIKEHLEKAQFDLKDFYIEQFSYANDLRKSFQY